MTEALEIGQGNEYKDSAQEAHLRHAEINVVLVPEVRVNLNLVHSWLDARIAQQILANETHTQGHQLLQIIEGRTSK